MSKSNVFAYKVFDGFIALYRLPWRAESLTVTAEEANGKPKPVIFKTAEKANLAAYQALVDELLPTIRSCEIDPQEGKYNAIERILFKNKRKSLF